MYTYGLRQGACMRSLAYVCNIMLYTRCPLRSKNHGNHGNDDKAMEKPAEEGRTTARP